MKMTFGCICQHSISSLNIFKAPPIPPAEYSLSNLFTVQFSTKCTSNRFSVFWFSILMKYLYMAAIKTFVTLHPRHTQTHCFHAHLTVKAARPVGPNFDAPYSLQQVACFIFISFSPVAWHSCSIHSRASSYELALYKGQFERKFNVIFIATFSIEL